MELKFLVKFTFTQCVLKTFNYKDLRNCIYAAMKVISADKVLMAIMVLMMRFKRTKELMFSTLWRRDKF